MISYKNSLSMASRLMVVMLAVTISACGGSSSDQVAMIPASSTVVMSVDLGQLAQKAISFSDLWDYMANQTDEDEIFERIENSGIDFTGTMYSYFNTSSGMEMEPGIIIPLTDADEFTIFLMETSTEMGSPFTKESTNGLNHAIIADGDAICVWDNDKALIIQFEGLRYDERINEKDLEDAIEQFSNGAEDQLARESSEFSDLLGEGHDLAFFMNYEKIAPMAMMMNPLVAQTGIQDMKLSAGIDFEDGEILMETHSFYDKTSARYIKVIGDDIDGDLLEDISSEHPVGFFSLAMDMEELYNLLDDFGLLEEIEDEMREEGIDLEETMEAFSGGIAGLVNEIAMKRSYYAPPDATPDQPDPRFVVSIGLDDHDEIESLMDRGVEEGAFTKNGNFYIPSTEEVYVILEDDRLIVADPMSFSAIQNGNLEDLPSDMERLATGNPMAMVMDFEQLPYVLWQEMFEDLPASQQGYAIDNFPLKRMTMYAEEPGSREAFSTITISTANSSENSLRTILDYVMTLAESNNGRNSGILPLGI